MPGMNMSAGGARGSTEHARAADCTVSTCPILVPGADELSVADQLGSTLAAAWVSPAGRGLTGRLELLNENFGSVREAATVAGVSSTSGCGPGCLRFTLPDRPATLRISAREHGRRYVLHLPIRWEVGQSAAARRILHQSVARMQSLPGVRVSETLTAGPPGPVQQIRYRLSAPDRMAYTVSSGAQVVTIRRTQWSYTPGHGWQRGGYGAGTFTTRDWYDWPQYARSIQLLDEHDVAGHRSADIALMSPRLPVWFRLHVDLPTERVSAVRMITGGHFMTDHYHDFGVPQRITPPPR